MNNAIKVHLCEGILSRDKTNRIWKISVTLFWLRWTTVIETT